MLRPHLKLKGSKSSLVVVACLTRSNTLSTRMKMIYLMTKVDLESKLTRSRKQSIIQRTAQRITICSFTTSMLTSKRIPLSKTKVEILITVQTSVKKTILERKISSDLFQELLSTPSLARTTVRDKFNRQHQQPQLTKVDECSLQDNEQESLIRHRNKTKNNNQNKIISCIKMNKMQKVVHHFKL